MKKGPLLLSILLVLACLSSLSAAPSQRRARGKIRPPALITVNLVDRNGITEIIRDKKRIAQFEKVNFLAPQPYQKVLRVFDKDSSGSAFSILTSYHPNSELKQYLEASGSRAFGLYKEWYASGRVKIEGKVVSGIADLHPQAQESWLFDGLTRAFDEDGALQAEIFYQKGELEGIARYYHKNGVVSKLAPYRKNQLHGELLAYSPQGSCLGCISYVDGVKEGKATCYWENGTLFSSELYQKGLLMQGSYQDPHGEALHGIEKGRGHRPIYQGEHLVELQEYQGGRPEGRVELFDELARKISCHSLKGGEKEGEELFFYPETGKPRLLLTWREGLMQGRIKTWYDNGALESQKEISQNKKNGTAFAWYRSGALMLMEEYENDRLIRGEYYRIGEKTPLSRIEKGRGAAHLFDGYGQLVQKVQYQDGKPAEL